MIERYCELILLDYNKSLSYKYVRESMTRII